jgi:hypothetical protein
MVRVFAHLQLAFEGKLVVQSYYDDFLNHAGC